MIVNAIFSIAKKEIMDNIRNLWIIIMSVIFALFALVFSYFGSSLGASPELGFQSFAYTIASMMISVVLLIPIIGLMLGYAAILGEIEKGSMSSLLSYSVSRIEVILGKFIGLGCVLFLSILIGFGVAGIIIAANISNPNYGNYLLFIGASVLLGFVFLSLAMLLSSLLKKRSAAIGGVVFLWFFFAMILPIVVGSIKLPTDWIYGVNLLNPISTYSEIISMSMLLEFLESMDLNQMYPPNYNIWLLVSTIAWIVIPLLLAILTFKRRDI